MPFRTSSRRSAIGVQSISPLNMIRSPSRTIFAACSRDTNFSRIAPPQSLSCQSAPGIGFIGGLVFARENSPAEQTGQLDMQITRRWDGLWDYNSCGQEVAHLSMLAQRTQGRMIAQ